MRQVDGHKIVSYGTSSYGYDVRCANEFKIFTNINSTIVDPKSFDEKSFVDFGGDVCIIPPNSFALARTVEYFRIPRSVLTICLGKCVTGDTRVVDAESGAYVPITEMRFGKQDARPWTAGALKPAKVSAFMPQGRRAGVRAAHRDRPAHSRHGQPSVPHARGVGAAEATCVPAIGSRWPRDIPVFGKTPIPDWEATLLGLMICEGQCHTTPGHSPTFTSADPALVQLLEDSVAASGLGTVTFKGSFGYRLVNREGRGGIAEHSRAHEWLKAYGLNVGAADKFVPQTIFTAPAQVGTPVPAGPVWRRRRAVPLRAAEFTLSTTPSRAVLSRMCTTLLLRFGIFSLIREKTTAIGTTACSIQITDRDQVSRFADEIGFVPGCVKQRRLDDKIMPLIHAKPARKSNFESLPREAWELVALASERAGVTLSPLDIHRTLRQPVSFAAAARVATTTRDPIPTPLLEGPVWDVVEAIEPAGAEEVFDISIPRIHNFVANDFIVHNSTYARCFSGDTRVALVDGTARTFEELVRLHEAGTPLRGYSIDANGRLIVAALERPRFIGRDSLLEIQLDNGERIQATPDHLFMQRDGHMTSAGSLRPGDALMPLYRDATRGREFVYQPAHGELSATQDLARRYELRQELGFASRLIAQHGRRFGAPRRAAYRNHRVVGIRELPGDHDVYCLTVPETGNFALEAGVFVKNCGIIVNVTPLEPEWEGHVTLEFSNTTTLPAKIYANEGVAQMLFFESDEVCSTSYRDRGGKYQGQRGVTLPKT